MKKSPIYLSIVIILTFIFFGAMGFASELGIHSPIGILIYVMAMFLLTVIGLFLTVRIAYPNPPRFSTAADPAAVMKSMYIPPSSVQDHSTTPQALPDDTAEIAKELRDRMTHFYGQSDGSFRFPNSCEGDLLRMTARLLGLLPNAKARDAE